MKIPDADVALMVANSYINPDQHTKDKGVEAATFFLFDNATFRILGGPGTKGLAEIYLREARRHLAYLSSNPRVPKDSALISRCVSNIAIAEVKMAQMVAASKPPVVATPAPATAPPPAPPAPVATEASKHYEDWMRLTTSKSAMDKAAGRKIYAQHRDEIEAEIARRNQSAAQTANLSGVIDRAASELLTIATRAIDDSKQPARPAMQAILDHQARAALRHFDEEIKAIESALNLLRLQRQGGSWRGGLKQKIDSLQERLSQTLKSKAAARTLLLQPKP